MRVAVASLLTLAVRLAAAQTEYGAPGPFRVGSTMVELTKSSVTTGEPRVLATHVWYPAKAETWSPEGQFRRDADVAKGRFPPASARPT